MPRVVFTESFSFEISYLAKCLESRSERGGAFLADAARAPQACEELRRKLAAKSVVVAEDDEDLSGEIAAIVRAAGALPVQVRTGHGLFTKVADTLLHGSKDRVSLVIADVYLPGITGLEAMARLRRCGVAAPLIVVTGQPSDDVDRAAVDAGANVVLCKPFTGTVLRRWIAALLAATPRS